MTTIWHGVLLDDRSALMMDAVQALVTASPNPFTISPSQGSYSVSVDASAGTHAGGGAIDISAATLTTTQRDFLVAAMRQVGWAAWLRTPAQGFSYHVHGIAVGCTDLSPEAAQQVQAYFAGLNGLRGGNPDDGPRDWVGVTWETYSGGTYVPPTGGDPVSLHSQYPGDRCGTFATAGGNLTGTPTWTVLTGSVPSARRFFGNMPGPAVDDPAPITLHLDAGDSIALGGLQDWYYDEFDDLTTGYWMVKVSGGGTLQVSDTFDLDFYYPGENPSAPWAWSPCAEVGTDAEFTYYAADPTLLDQAHLLDNGYVLVRLACTTGTVDVEFVGLRINQVQGYFDAVLDGDGDIVTTDSITYPESYREPLNTGTHTYATTHVGGEAYFTVDGSLSLHPVIDPVTGSSTDWRGSGDSLLSAEFALDDANTDFGPFGTLQGPDAFVHLQYNPPHGDILGPIPENWEAQVHERVAYQSAPSKSTLDDIAPEGFYSLQRWEAVAYEWTDDNTELMGWTIFGADPVFDTLNYVATEGDGDQVTYSVILSSLGGEDLSSAWFTLGEGIAITSGTTTDTFPGTVNPGGIPADPYLLPIDDTFIATTDRLIYQRIELARRFDPDRLDQFTTWNGYSGGNEGTSAFTTSRRNSDNANLGGGRVSARFRIPPWRLKYPTYRPAAGPAPTIDFDEDPSVTWLRQRQRNDGLGNSITRARGVSSQQRSLRQRGYR